VVGVRGDQLVMAAMINQLIVDQNRGSIGFCDKLLANLYRNLKGAFLLIDLAPAISDRRGETTFSKRDPVWNCARNRSLYTCCESRFLLCMNF
jgi:hypothetical protein